MSRNNQINYRHRPGYLRLANFAGDRLGLNAQVSFDAGELISTATHSTGLNNFGPDGWREGFERLCAALITEAELNWVGRLSARHHLLQLLRNRLHIEQARGDDPVIATQEIDRPVFITGLPRTGSTLLQGLMAQDPAVRVPWTWELMLAGSPPGADAKSDQRAIAKSASMLRWVHRLAPQFRSIHPVEAFLPQECIAMTAHDFASVEFHTTFNVPAYQAWVDGEDQISALRYHHRIAQHLQRHSGPRQWVFKAPAHLYALPAILAVYPDARFVMTHRDPYKVVASIASHGVVLRNAFSDEVDNTGVAQYWMHWWAEGLKRARAYRREHTSLFIDLDYRTLVADPINALKDLYANLDLPFAEPTRLHMQQFLSEHKQDKHGRHRYTLEQFGLSPQDVDRLYAPSKN